MFGFDEPKAERLGSYGRFWERQDRFKKDGEPLPKLRHHAWWLLHNIAAHTAIGLVPTEATFQFHDWTSRRLNHSS